MELSPGRHLWKLSGCRWAELPPGSVSLFLLWATLLPVQRLQVSASDTGGKNPGGCLGGAHPTAPHPSSYEATRRVQSPRAARSARAQCCSQGPGATRLISAPQIPYHETQTRIFSCRPCPAPALRDGTRPGPRLPRTNALITAGLDGQQERTRGISLYAELRDTNQQQ